MGVEKSPEMSHDDGITPYTAPVLENHLDMDKEVRDSTFDSSGTC